MPENPESEGSRLITLKQIEQEHGVSRSALHTYRRSASFPQPVQVEGSTKTQYRADEVAAWFAANPKQQGKRTDLAPRDEGVAMLATQQDARTTQLAEDEWAQLCADAFAGAFSGACKVGLSEEQSTELANAAGLAVRSRLQEWGLLAK
ncbi:helix-turn-helix transcriptional regulator [Streptomyces sp. 900105755]